MLSGHPHLNLPAGSTLVEDADEEIFLLYTNKQQSTTSASKGRCTSKPVGGGGLGINSQAGDVLNLSLKVENPWSTTREGREQQKGKKSIKGKEKESFEVEIELHQSLNNLRNRAGDTGSVLWRLSLHLAKFLLTSHHFPHPTSFPPLLPNLSRSRILELGSGTGFLGIALRSVSNNSNSSYPSPSSRKPLATSASSIATLERTNDYKWTFSDQLENLPLILRNLRSNSIPPSEIGEDSNQPYSVIELDWIRESNEYVKASSFSSPSIAGSSKEPNDEGFDLIFAVDCIYNPSLSIPLAHTILHHSTSETIVVVVSELRESEALETFLTTWLEEGEKRFRGLGWKVARLGREVEGGEEGREEEDRRKYREEVVGDLGDSGFVVWVGWCDSISNEST